MIFLFHAMADWPFVYRGKGHVCEAARPMPALTYGRQSVKAREELILFDVDRLVGPNAISSGSCTGVQFRYC